MISVRWGGTQEGFLLPVRNQLLTDGEPGILGHGLSLPQVLLAQVRQPIYVVPRHIFGGDEQHIAVLLPVHGVVAQDVIPLSDAVEGPDGSRGR